MADESSDGQNGNEYVIAMGPELGVVFNELHTDLVWLHMRWAMYRQLFAGSFQRIDVLNETAATFFYVVQNTLWEDVLLSLAKLTDPPRSGGKENLSLRSLPPLIEDEAVRLETERLLRAATSACESARCWRNKRIAHRDFTTARATAADGLPGVSRADVEAALGLCRALLNGLQWHYVKSTCGYEYGITGPRDADGLVFYLNRGLRAVREEEQRLRSGDLRPEDLLPDMEV